eukprot:gene10818-14523_t
MSGISGIKFVSKIHREKKKDVSVKNKKNIEAKIEHIAHISDAVDFEDISQLDEQNFESDNKSEFLPSAQLDSKSANFSVAEMLKQNLKASMRTGSRINSVNDTALLKRKYKDDENDIDKIITKRIIKSHDKIFNGLTSDRTGKDEDDNYHFENEVEMGKNNKKVSSHKITSSSLVQTNYPSCTRCITNNSTDINIIMKSDYYSLIMKNPDVSLCDGLHCEIIPSNHFNSFTRADESTTTEIYLLRKKLSNFFWLEYNKYTLFIESAVNYKSKYRHCEIDVIPIDPELLSEAKMLFKESFLNCEDGLSNNKPIIELANNKLLSDALPENFDYIACEWSVYDSINRKFDNSGYLHIVENSNINYDFGVDVIAGLLDMDPTQLRRKKSLSVESSNICKRWVREFKQKFSR